ncbi:glycosyltransferase [Streptomyces sp. NPDC002577]
MFWQDDGNLVEDYETTLALKESGWKVTANEHCIAYTDLMPSLRQSIGQRERWGRGTVDTLRRRGWTSSVNYTSGIGAGAVAGGGTFAATGAGSTTSLIIAASVALALGGLASWGASTLRRDAPDIAG